MKNSIFNAVCKTRYLALLVVLIFTCGNAWGAKITYTFSTKGWAASPANWTSGKDGNGFTANQGIQVTTGASGANGTSPKGYTGINKIEVQYCTNASKGVGTIKVQVGSGTEQSFSVTKPSSGGTTLKTATFNYTTPETGKVKVTATCSTNSVYIWSVTIYYQTVITLNKNGGASDGSIKFQHDGTAYVTSSFTPVTRSNYTCTGYWTAASAGTKILDDEGAFAGANISVNSVPYITSSKWAYADSILTLYAQWESAGTSVTLSKAATTNGSFTLKSGSCSGSEITGNPPTVTTTSSPQTVYIVPSPNNGYQVNTVTSKLGDAAAVNVSKSGTCYPVTYAQSASGTAVITVTFSCVTPTFGTDLSTTAVNYTQGDSPTALTVAASANNATINYQWQKSSDGSSWMNDGTNSSSNTSYSPSTASVGTMYYRCIATNAATGCSATATSNTATVVVAAASGYCISVYNSSNNGIQSGFNNGGSGSHYTLSFTVPGKDGSSNWPMYWVGENNASQSYSTNATLADMPLYANSSTAKLGLAEGATGTLHIWDDNKASGSNLWVKFQPSGYGLRWGGAGDWNQAANTKPFTVDANDANVYWTDIVTLDGTNNTSWNYYVGLQTASGYVYSGVDDENSDQRGVSRTRSVTAMKVSNGTAGQWKATYLNSEPTGSKGKFRIWDNNTDDYGHNLCCHWVPFYEATYDANGGGAISPAAVNVGPVCCEGTPSERQVTMPAAPSRTDYSFGGWKSSADDVVYAAGATVSLTQNTTFTAQWTHNPELTVSKSSIAFGSKKVDGSYTETFTVAGNYLTANIGIAVSGDNSAMFTVSSSTLTPSDGSVATTTITVTYSPTTAASHSATITISSTGVSDKTISLTGTGQYQDTYIDNIWNQSVAVQTGSYTRPSISDQDDNDQTDCQHLHYHFVGWITKAKYDAGTAIAAGDIQATGSVTASNATFYAVWAKEAAGGGGANVFTLVEETPTDWSGRYLLVDYENNSHAMKNTVNSGKLSSESVSPSNKQITCTDNTIIWIVAQGTGSDAGKYSVQSEGSSKYANSGSSSTSASLNDAASYLTFTVDDTYGIRITGSGSRWFSMYTDYTFRTYNQSTNYGVKLYRNSVSYTDSIASCGAEYDIVLDKNGGTTDGSGAKVTANATALNSGFTAPIYAGHQVDYYMVASASNSTKIAEADGSLVANVSVNSTPWTDANGKWVKGGDATFYAKWKATECVITLNNEGAQDAGTESVTATYGASTNLTTSIMPPTKNGYDFGGYYTAANGSGVKLINADGSWVASASGGGNTYTNASKQWQYDATALELHAQWTLKSYTVTWVVNGETEATQTSVSYGTAYSALTEEPDVADNALSDCGSDKFVGWVTQEYTAEGGTAAAQYDPYKVSASMLIDDNHHTFYAMFAKESGSVFTADTTGGDFKIYATHSGTKYYATGNVSGNKIEDTDDVTSASTYTFTRLSKDVYSIGLKGATGTATYITKSSSNTDFGTASGNSDNAAKWTVSASTAGKGSWKIVSNSATTRGFVYGSSQTKFGTYQISDAEGNNTTYYCVEIANSSLTDYRTGCCDEKITLAVSDATSGAGGTVTLKWNNADKSAGDQVSTCSAGTLVAKVTANPGYILTAIAISGTDKTITTTPANLTTGLPSTVEMTYSVLVQALATGTLTITPTFSHTYTVTYDLADGETSGSTATVRYQSGETVTLVTPAPTKSGYNFTGWTVTKEGGDNVTVSGGKFTMPADNVTATATWAEKTLTSINLGSASVEVYVGQYVEIPVTYDPADILTKNYKLVANPSYCVTTNSTSTTLKITGGRGGVTITENKTETVSIKANADNSKTASVSVTVKPLPVDHFVDLIHGVSFDDKGSTIVNNELSATYTAPGYGDYSGSTTGDCETNHLHLVGWIDSEWADAHPKATHAEIIAAEGYHTAREAGMTASNKTYYAVWGDEQ